VNVIALGALEFGSIALGISALDEMLKIAPVRILEARTICPGKYLVVFTGDVASVEFSFAKGFETGKKLIVDSLLLPMVHPDVVQAIGKIIPTSQWDAIGIIETFSVVSSIEAADRAVKVGGIRIVEIRLAIGFGGKSYVKIIGNLDAVQAAMEAGITAAEEKNQLCMSILIPQPHNETKPYFFQ
jgi:microcompartment protein CcmL/EutN